LTKLHVVNSNIHAYTYTRVNSGRREYFMLRQVGRGGTQIKSI